MSLGIDSSILLAYYQSRSGATPIIAASATAAKKPVPTAPWSGTPNPADASAAVKAALAGHKLIDESAAKLDVTGASADYRKLFALYQGLNTLDALAGQAQAKGLTSIDKTRLESTFAKGLSQVTDYMNTLKLDQLRLTEGTAATSAKTAVGIPVAKTDYLTPPLATSTADSVPAFEGDVKFTMTIKRIGVEHNVDIDLGGMGSTPRTIGAVVNYINDQLAAEGVATRLASQRMPGQPREVKVGTQTVTLPPSSDQWALKVKVDSSETVSFSAPDTAGAVYMAQSVGNPDPDGMASTDDSTVSQQFVKFQTDNGIPPPLQTAGATNWTDGRVFAQTLGPEVKTVHDTKMAPDGSVYMLADVTGTIEGQDLRGAQDVALLKYDSAGKLIYARTLGASGSATGLSLAVADDGRVAVAGAVTGALNGAVDGPLNSGGSASFADQSDGFVTVYDADGQEMWTARRGARQADEASDVSFGADGEIYVAGRSKSAIPGAESIGDWDSYLQGFQMGSDGKLKTLFTQSFGTTGADRPAGMVVDGANLITASVENGHGVLRRFDISSGTPVLATTRDLGDLQGGDIIGLQLDGGQIVVAGNTANAALSAGTVTRANAGGTDAFAARLSADLSADPSDAIAYYGGTGEDRATALSVADGKVFLGGTAGADLPGQDPIGTKDGFLTQLNVDTGAIDWSRRFTGKDGRVAPTAIVAAATGASVLDRLGLPTGTLDMTDSTRLTAVSSLRGGDQFTIQVGTSRAATVTLDDKDTLDTLALKIRRATSFQAKVTISIVSGVRKLTIAPLNDRSIIEIGPGKTDKDALAVLGIPEGVVRATTVDGAGKTVSADGKGMFYGLGLESGLNLSTTDQIAHARAELQAALGVIRTAYKDLAAAANPQAAAAKAIPTGPVPAYLTAQIANYQAALTRLTGGS
ncbi:MAG: regulatory protein FlaEY [Caulobacteraceae bacterium]|nr:regulatory protein FlaEY [Caulobacteraceae bacterium]